MTRLEAIERARAVDMVAVAQKLGAELRRQGAEFVGPCPVCGGTDRFGVNARKKIWNCRGCSKGGDVIALVEHVSGCAFSKAVERLTGETWPRREIAEPAPRNGASTNTNAAAAGRIWRASEPIRGTLAERYLVGRRIDLERLPDLDDVLRFHHACPFGDDKASCLIALVRDVITDVPKAIVRTALDADGRKLDRKALGPIGDGAIKLWSDEAVTTGLVVGEGLETAASAATRIKYRGTVLQPAWALIDSNNLKQFPVLPGVDALTVLVDHDARDPRTGKQPGQDAAAACAARWSAAGREVIRLTPKASGSDFNNVVLS